MLFISINTIGQFIYALGGARVNYTLMLSGRLIYGCGAEAMDVAQTTFIAHWFRGKELAFAFGLSYVADFTGFLQGWS
jgi:MFS family permease